MRRLYLAIPLLTLAILLLYLNRPTEKIDTISLHVGKPYKEVLRDSTFPVKSKTVIRQTTPPEEDSTWITSPTIMQFDDPQYGFTLPPSKFVVVGYSEEKVTTITTSPMLETLNFDDLIPILNNLQNMLKNSGWTLRDQNENWFNLGTEPQRKALQRLLFKQAEVVMLAIPKKYMLVLAVKCYARCDERDPNTAKYLIDISVGEDFRRK